MFGRPPCSCVLQGVSDFRSVVYITCYQMIPAVHTLATHISIHRPLDLQSPREFKVVPERWTSTASCFVPFPVNRCLFGTTHVIEHSSGLTQMQQDDLRGRLPGHRQPVHSKPVCCLCLLCVLRGDLWRLTRSDTCLGAFLGPTCYSRKCLHSVVRSNLTSEYNTMLYKD